MADYAVHDGTTVLNVIVADSQEVAESVTGLQAVETEGSPWINWTWDEDSLTWIEPVPDPEPSPED